MPEWPHLAAFEEAEGPDLADAQTELEEIHVLLDRLCVPDPGGSATDRLIELIATALGDRVRGVLHVETGKTLARYHLETCNHKEECPCQLCRDARALR